jgi:hypothetical protein
MLYEATAGGPWWAGGIKNTHRPAAPVLCGGAGTWSGGRFRSAYGINIILIYSAGVVVPYQTSLYVKGVKKGTITVPDLGCYRNLPRTLHRIITAMSINPIQNGYTIDSLKAMPAHVPVIESMKRPKTSKRTIQYNASEVS